MSKKRPRHLSAGEFNEEEKFKERKALNDHYKKTAGTRWHRYRWGFEDFWGRKSDGCLWVMLKKFVFAPLVLFAMIRILKACGL